MRYARRTMVGVWVGVPVAGLLALNAIQRGRDWRGDMLLAADAQGIVLFVVGPLLCAVVAVDSARASQAGNLQDVALTRPWMRPYLYSLAVGTGSAAFVLLGGGLAAVFASGSYYFQLGDFVDATIQLALLALSLVYFGAIGSLIGRVSSPALAGLIAAVVGFALFTSESARGEAFGLMTLGGATVSRVGLEYVQSYRVWQAILLLALAVVAMLARPSFTGAGTRVSIAVFLAGVLAIGTPFAVAAAKPSVLPTQRWAEKADPIPWRCDGGSPALCMVAHHSHLRPLYRSQLDAIASGARAAGIENILPDQVFELSRNSDSIVVEGASWAFSADESYHSGLPGLSYFTSEVLSTYWHNCPWEWFPSNEQDRALEDLRATLLLAVGDSLADADVSEGFKPLTASQAAVALRVINSCG